MSHHKTCWAEVEDRGEITFCDKRAAWVFCDPESADYYYCEKHGSKLREDFPTIYSDMERVENGG